MAIIAASVVRAQLTRPAHEGGHRNPYLLRNSDASKFLEPKK
jgi:hypothetical protein